MSSPETEWINIAIAAIGGFLGAIGMAVRAAWNLSKQISRLETKVMVHMASMDQRVTALENLRRNGPYRENKRNISIQSGDDAVD
jgi:hypothetical protein